MTADDISNPPHNNPTTDELPVENRLDTCNKIYPCDKYDIQFNVKIYLYVYNYILLMLCT